MEWEKSGLCTNAYTLGCDALCRRQHYCVCVNFLKALEENRIGDSFLDCQRAVRSGNCVAFEMREEEKTKNIAIYFEERRHPVRQPIDRPLVTKKKNIRSVIKKTSEEVMIGSDLTAGINSSLTTPPSPYPKPRLGEDLLTFALRFKKYEEAQYAR